MADEPESQRPETQRLELRITELENKVEELMSVEPVDISADELAAYAKVANALAVIACGRACGRSCGRGCYACGACIAAASDFTTDAVMVCGRCGRGCGRGCAACIAAAEADFGTDAVMVCGRCGRGCGRGCAACIAAAAEDDFSVEALAVCGRCGRGGCILAACGRGCYMAGQAGPGPAARRGLGRFASLGG